MPNSIPGDSYDMAEGLRYGFVYDEAIYSSAIYVDALVNGDAP